MSMIFHISKFQFSSLLLCFNTIFCFWTERINIRMKSLLLKAIFKGLYRGFSCTLIFQLKISLLFARTFPQYVQWFCGHCSYSKNLIKNIPEIIILISFSIQRFPWMFKQNFYFIYLVLILNYIKMSVNHWDFIYTVYNICTVISGLHRNKYIKY